MTINEWEALLACCAYVESNTPGGVRVDYPTWAEGPDGFNITEIVRRARECLRRAAPAAVRPWKYREVSVPAGVGSPAHRILVDRVRVSKGRLVELIEAGGRDFDVVRQALDDYADYQRAADLVSGQA